jgi:urate oxidase
MKLLHHHYGKARIRVMKVSREGERHLLKELDVSVLLQGDFDASYTKADNRLVVPTDTMKNTVNVLAKEKLGAETEPFGLVVGRHFLETYPQVETVQVNLSERCWERITVQGRPHAHSFTEKSPAKPFAEVTCSRKETIVQSGINDLLILKTTESGFEGYDLKDKFTTLPETKDRIFATQLRATWFYARQPSSYVQANARILDAMLEVFASTYSPSVQVTLFQMGEAALKAAAEISKITLAMPNKHCLLINLGAFGIENRNELFLPTDEPHGQIEGTIVREG